MNVSTLDVYYVYIYDYSLILLHICVQITVMNWTKGSFLSAFRLHRANKRYSGASVSRTFRTLTLSRGYKSHISVNLEHTLFTYSLRTISRIRHGIARRLYPRKSARSKTSWHFPVCIARRPDVNLCLCVPSTFSFAHTYERVRQIAPTASATFSRGARSNCRNDYTREMNELRTVRNRNARYYSEDIQPVDD